MYIRTCACTMYGNSINNYSRVSHTSVYTVCILQVVHHSPRCSFTADGILGMNVAIASMRRGELSRFLVAPNYAFGVRGCPPRVPPNSTSEYTVCTSCDVPPMAL